MVTYRIHNKFLDMHRTLAKLYDKQDAAITKSKFNVKLTTTTDEDGTEMKLPTYKELQLANGKVEVSFEALPFLFSINGHDKNLLLFIIAYCLNENSVFPWNRIVAAHYADFYEAMMGKRITYDTIRQSVVTLAEKNAIRKIGNRTFMLNPLLCNSSQHNKSKLIKEYGQFIKGKNVIESLFLP